MSEEFPPYTLPLETGNFLEEENYENQGINLPRSGEELSEVPEPVVEIQNGEGELVLIPSESNEHQLSSCEEAVRMQTCNSDNSGVIHEGSVSGDTEGNTQTENSWGNRLRPRDRSGRLINLPVDLYVKRRVSAASPEIDGLSLGVECPAKRKTRPCLFSSILITLSGIWKLRKGYIRNQFWNPNNIRFQFSLILQQTTMQ
ncbi:hypothetical protein CDAR_426211 [Caerostris darwini]|uniref:Uncharacterized protein n=1 Tax=Caerostris darwini TaxID=1538125 RepID=A0AAV4UA07_9ARAC|nr:hypothetical protein CDAR_426211 [Caerostris darwini]